MPQIKDETFDIITLPHLAGFKVEFRPEGKVCAFFTFQWLDPDNWLNGNYLSEGQKTGDTGVYHSYEIERMAARLASERARSYVQEHPDEFE
jgi:hypothetical protein